MTQALRELGLELRRHREQLGIDLDELQVRTKIRKRYLSALEEGDWSILPGDVYARGFVRSYADAVGADGHALLATYSVDKAEKSPQVHKDAKTERQTPSAVTQTIQPPTQVASTNTEKPNRETKSRAAGPVKPVQLRRKSRGIGGGGQVAVVLGTLVVLGAGWYAVDTLAGKHNATGKNQVATTPPSHSSQPVSASTHNQGGTSEKGATTPQKSGTTPATAAPVITESPFNITSDKTVTYTVKATEPLSVALTAAHDRCWVSVTADSKTIDGSDIISQGQTKSWQATRTMSIQVGNVPATTLNINGQSVTLPAVTRPLVVTVVKAQS